MSAIYLAWLTICVVDTIGGFLGGLQMYKEYRLTVAGKNKRSARYLAHILLSTGYRSATTVIGLYLFGLNVQATPWYLWLGFTAMAYKAFSTWGWILYMQGIFNGVHHENEGKEAYPMTEDDKEKPQGGESGGGHGPEGNEPSGGGDDEGGQTPGGPV